MTTFRPEVWRRAESLFAAALDRPEQERPAFLRHACAGDVELRAAVESLLAVDGEAASFLESPVPGAASSELGDEGEAWRNRHVGRYRVLHQIGQGGMGRVFLGEHTGDGIEKQVAIKWLDRASDPVLRQSFAREGQILSRLEHPNIARFLDSGTIGDGIPYVVMEHVPGAPLTEFCAACRLDLRRRLELFLKVCAAVAYAHQNLVVHRDLKPGNVLVTDEGEPKLLDFGIAKWLELAAGDGEQTTATRDRFLTPSYASPEQLAGLPVTTAADVYALGVILYELLTGLLPFDLRRLPALEARKILESGPRPPSQALSEIPARQREVEVRPARLRGDLDKIVLLCLRFEPAARYGTVEQLAADVSRHLAGLPVMARRPSLAYRLSKLVRRHALAAVIAAVAAVALGVLVVLLALRADQLERERDLARRAQGEAESMTRFLADAFRLTDPHQRGDLGRPAAEEISAWEILDFSVERVEHQFAGQPLVQAELMDTLGRIFQNLGRHGQAVSLFEKALARKRRGSTQASELVTSLNGLGSSLIDGGHLDEARVVLREALALAEHFPVSEENQVESRRFMGRLLLETSDYTAGAELLRQALARYRGLEAAEDRILAGLLIDLGLACLFLRDLEVAEEDLREALAILRQLPGGERPEEAEAMHYLSLVLARGGDFGAAEPLLRRAVELRRRLHGPEHPETLTSLATLGEFLVSAGEYDSAEVVLREMLALDRKVKGEHHHHVAIDLRSLAEVHWQRGDLVTAEKLLRQALELAEAAWGEENRATLDYLQALGEVLFEKGEDRESELILRRVLERQSALFGAEDWHVAKTSLALADLLAEDGRFAEASSLAELGLKVASRRFPAGHNRLGIAMSVRGYCLAGHGSPREAETLLVEGLSFIESGSPKGMMARHVRRANQRLARFYQTRGKNS